MNIRKVVDYSGMFAALESVMEADSPQMELYCEAGKTVCTRLEKGAAVAAAGYLTEKYLDMSGFSPRNVRRMRDFWQMYGDMPELLDEALLLNWTQNVVIMEAELTTEERRWYIGKAAESSLSKAELLRMIQSGAHLEISLDEIAQNWYTEENDESSEREQYEKDPVYLPRQYPKKPRKSLLYQWFSSLKRRLLHHNYTICERALMWQRPRHGMNTRKRRICPEIQDISSLKYY